MAARSTRGHVFIKAIHASARKISACGGRSFPPTCIRTHSKQPHPAERPSTTAKRCRPNTKKPPQPSPDIDLELALPARFVEAVAPAISGPRYSCG